MQPNHDANRARPSRSKLLAGMSLKQDFVRSAALGGLLGLLAGAAVMAAPAADTAVKIDNFTFAPQRVTVKAGTTVTWTNNDDVPHNVVSLDKTSFKSKALDTGEKFSYTFTKPGNYPYFCSIHPKMTAEIVVQ